MVDSDDSQDDAFLPSENDKLKAQIRDLQRRLEAATNKERKLKRELIEEDLSYVTVSNLTKLIQDPTRIAEVEMNEMQKEIFDKLMYTAEICCVREIISYHRLSGRSVFTFKGNHNCIRLDTFYNKSFNEPYYIIYTNQEGNYIPHHTIPPFIHLNALEKQFLPNAFNPFIRIVHNQLQAFVTKREMMKEIYALSKSTAFTKISYQSESLHKIEIFVTAEQLGDELQILLLFKDKSSCYPTDVTVRKRLCPEIVTDSEAQLFLQVQQDFASRNTKQVLIDLINRLNDTSLEDNEIK